MSARTSTWRRAIEASAGRGSFFDAAANKPTFDHPAEASTRVKQIDTHEGQ